jgi:hypothetical protein
LLQTIDAVPLLRRDRRLAQRIEAAAPVRERWDRIGGRDVSEHIFEVPEFLFHVSVVHCFFAVVSGLF